MTQTIEEVKRVALDIGAFVAVDCATYRLMNCEIVFVHEGLQAFAQHYIEVGRKEQREKDALIAGRIKPKDVSSLSNAEKHIWDIAAINAYNAIRNNTGE